MNVSPIANPLLAAVAPSPIAETRGWVLGRSFPADKPLIDLAQAVPGHPPPGELREHLAGVLRDPGKHGYTAILGIPELREAYNEVLPETRLEAIGMISLEEASAAPAPAGT